VATTLRGWSDTSVLRGPLPLSWHPVRTLLLRVCLHTVMRCVCGLDGICEAQVGTQQALAAQRRPPLESAALFLEAAASGASAAAAATAALVWEAAAAVAGPPGRALAAAAGMLRALLLPLYQARPRMPCGWHADQSCSNVAQIPVRITATRRAWLASCLDTSAWPARILLLRPASLQSCACLLTPCQAALFGCLETTPTWSTSSVRARTLTSYLAAQCMWRVRRRGIEQPSFYQRRAASLPCCKPWCLGQVAAAVVLGPLRAAGALGRALGDALGAAWGGLAAAGAAVRAAGAAARAGARLAPALGPGSRVLGEQVRCARLKAARTRRCSRRCSLCKLVQPVLQRDPRPLHASFITFTFALALPRSESSGCYAHTVANPHRQGGYAVALLTLWSCCSGACTCVGPQSWPPNHLAGELAGRGAAGRAGAAAALRHQELPRLPDARPAARRAVLRHRAAPVRAARFASLVPQVHSA